MKVGEFLELQKAANIIIKTEPYTSEEFLRMKFFPSGDRLEFGSYEDRSMLRDECTKAMALIFSKYLEDLKYKLYEV